MIKAVLIDADGVAIKAHDYFSNRYAAEYDIEPSLVSTFFKEKFGLCSTGKADLKEELTKVLPSWGWKGTVDDLLAYWFSGEQDRDEMVLAQAREWRSKGIQCFLATDQERYRASYLLNVVNLKDSFDGAFFSYDLGFQKHDPEFFEAIISTLGLSPDQIAYFDDDKKNVEVAKALGISAKFYQGISDLVL